MKLTGSFNFFIRLLDQIKKNKLIFKSYLVAADGFAKSRFGIEISERRSLEGHPCEFQAKGLISVFSRCQIRSSCYFEFQQPHPSF